MCVRAVRWNSHFPGHTRTQSSLRLLQHCECRPHNRCGIVIHRPSWLLFHSKTGSRSPIKIGIFPEPGVVAVPVVHAPFLADKPFGPMGIDLQGARLVSASRADTMDAGLALVAPLAKAPQVVAFSTLVPADRHALPGVPSSDGLCTEVVARKRDRRT
ncbi:hypothetical protein LX36DRAFT_103515 [Colletotrichum falcatum]|nr:hypothetical protein LX36DRAFT_103515 [Colletotrichum falcatum]